MSEQPPSLRTGKGFHIRHQTRTIALRMELPMPLCATAIFLVSTSMYFPNVVSSFVWRIIVRIMFRSTPLSYRLVA